MKKIISAVMCLLFVLPMFCSCKKNAPADEDGKTKTDTVNLSVWTTSDRLEKTRQIVSAFQLEDVSKDWNITVKGVDDVKKQMTDNPSVTADIFCFSSKDFDELYKSGILCKSGTEETPIKLRNVSESVKVASADKDMYAYPLSVDTLVMYYDKSKFNEDEVKKLETVMFKDLGEGKTNLSFNMASYDVLSSFFLTNGCNLYGEDGNDTTVCDFNSENGRSAAEYMIDLASNEKFKSEDDEKVISMFSSGDLAAAFMSSKKYDEVKKALGDNFAVTTLPQISINDKEMKMISFAVYDMYAVNANSENAEAADKLADYLTSQQSQEMMIDLNYAPTNMTLCAKEEILDKNEFVKAVVKQSDKSKHEPNVQKIVEYKTSAEAFGSKIADKTYTKTDVKTKLDEFVKQVTD